MFRTYTNCGTLGYTAPEVLLNVNEGYSFQADVWTFGIFLCELFQGCIPFDHKDDPTAIEAQIIKCDYKMPREIDQATRDLISSILVLEPNLRPTFKDLMHHRFFGDINWDQVRSRALEPVPFRPNPEKFKELLDNEHDLTTVGTTQI